MQNNSFSRITNLPVGCSEKEPFMASTLSQGHGFGINTEIVLIDTEQSYELSYARCLGQH